jgi:two-component system sensor histidine kinase/response regulator
MMSSIGRLRLQLMLGTALVVTVSGIIGLYAISKSNERNRVDETLLYELQANAQGLSSNEWEAIASTKVDSDLRTRSDSFRREILNDLQKIERLQGPDTSTDKVQSAASAYLSAMDQEFELISNGQLDEARALDDSHVDPSFAILEQTIREAVSRFEVHAQQSRRTAFFASVATLLGCLVAILLLALRFERGRSLQETNARLNELVTQLSLSQEKAEASSRAKSEFLANMSHEIRTPLNGVMGMTDLALGTELTSEQREYLETVKVSADSLLTVINDILDFSKIEAGKLDMEAVDFNLRDCLETTMKTLSLRADEKGLELLCEVAPKVPEIVRADSSRLRQIVVNLVGNAIKFTHEGEVALKVESEGENGRNHLLHFEVSDTGIGIAPDKQKFIFDSFTQADSSTTRKYGGTGLGLTISKRLVEMMDGKIWVESEAGQGAHFHFKVQVEAPDTKAVEVGTIAPMEILRGVKVLVVDDSRTNRRILEGMLKRWEMKSTSVESGAEALAELSAAHNAQTRYGLILLDMHMPTMDGFTLVDHLRQRPELCTAIVVMLTSAGHRGDAARCRDLGICAYLLKPIRQMELREAIARALGAGEQQGAIPLITRYSLHGAGEPSSALLVLIAEDNLVNQRLTVRLLEKRGHRVIVVGNGRDALEALDKESFDLVLMDVQMPEMDGLAATAALRKKEKETGDGQRQTVIALTAHAMRGDYERCIAAGMDGYLTKPIRPQELDEMLAKCLVRKAELSNASERAAQTGSYPETAR